MGQYRELDKWKSFTKQSAQVDSGYLGQHLISILTNVPGRGEGGRGKGLDLIDGSEVKVASTFGGVDVPRWNNLIIGKAKKKKYLAFPNIYLVLFDTLNKEEKFPVRIRVWRIRAQDDKIFQTVVNKWFRKRTSGNFQIHPPCWKDNNIVTNESGNISAPLMFEAVQLKIGEIDFVQVNKFTLNTRYCKIS
ncbi:MAG: MamI family restriction endonuclease [Ignavibacteriaceae bacterium]